MFVPSQPGALQEAARLVTDLTASVLCRTKQGARTRSIIHSVGQACSSPAQRSWASCPALPPSTADAWPNAAAIICTAERASAASISVRACPHSDRASPACRSSARGAAISPASKPRLNVPVVLPSVWAPIPPGPEALGLAPAGPGPCAATPRAEQLQSEPATTLGCTQCCSSQPCPATAPPASPPAAAAATGAAATTTAAAAAAASRATSDAHTAHGQWTAHASTARWAPLLRSALCRQIQPTFLLHFQVCLSADECNGLLQDLPVLVHLTALARPMACSEHC